MITLACQNLHTADATGYIGLVQVSFFITVVIGQILIVLNTCGVAPIIIDRAIDKQTAAQTIFSNALTGLQATLSACIFITNLTSNFYIVGIAFQFCHANAQIVQLIGKFGSQLINIRALSHSLSHDLRHFIASHQLIAGKGGITIALDYACCRKLVDAVISPMSCGNIGERVSGKSGSAHAQSHCHSQYQRFFHHTSLLVIKNNSIIIIRKGMCETAHY